MFSGLTQQLKLPDPWQHQAVNLLRSGKDVIVSAPTGAGKTFVFELIVKSHHFKGQLVYTVPTRALANDKHAEWTEAGWDVGLATGDLAINVHAPVLVATLETQIERLLRNEGPDLLVIDEYQMIADPSRGSHYEGAIILTPPKTQLLLLSGSVGNPRDVATWMQRLGRQTEVVSTEQRPVPLEDFPLDYHQSRYKSIENRWARFATAALVADLAPLLIFAPRRKDAEAIATKIASHLPPGEPLSLTAEQRALAGKEMAAMLEKRVAYHHSGMSYVLRAGLVEPLAKAGQLRVIVSTMGLAAGINFSVRSVHVSGTSFHDGVSEQQISADELLQMFGRAGRRGLDERGFVITTRDSPTLADARPKRLRRGNKLSWPLFLRVMHHAAQEKKDPFAAAIAFSTKLYAKTPPDLGIGTQVESSSSPAAGTTDHTWFGLKGTRRELLNSRGKWESLGKLHKQMVALRDVFIVNEHRQIPATASTDFIASLHPELGRISKLSEKGTSPPVYGREIVLGKRVPHDSDHSEVRIVPTRALRKMLHIPHRIESIRMEKIHQLIIPKLIAHFQGVTYADLIWREDLLLARFDLSAYPIEAVQDSHGQWIFQPQIRTQERSVETTVEAANFRDASPRSGSAIHAWRSLGLIHADGSPTERGQLFSFFQQGEGLAIAAALEDESYPIDELLPHLANLRGGGKHHADEILDAIPSERLSAICRSTYGFVNHTGYLEAGLPIGYGEGVAELLGLSNDIDAESVHATTHAARTDGDLSRAYTEWLSLLRHLHHAPSHPWPRWGELQKQAAELLRKHLQLSGQTLHPKLPPLTPKQKHDRPMHYILRKSLHG